METSNIGTLNALADLVKQPFRQDAAKAGGEPRFTDAAQATNVSFAGFGPTSEETPHAG